MAFHPASPEKQAAAAARRAEQREIDRVNRRAQMREKAADTSNPERAAFWQELLDEAEARDAAR